MAPSRRTVLGTAALANGSQFGARVVISPFIPAIALTFGATKATIGLVLTGLWAVFAVAHFPSGVLADRFGPSVVIRVALVLVAIGSLLIATAPTLLAFAVGCIVLGLGSGSYFPTGQTLLSHRYGEGGRGQALSIHTAGGPVAGVIFPAIATAVALRYDWRAGVAVGTVALGITVGIVAITLRGGGRGSSDVNVAERLRPLQILTLMARPPVLATLALGSASMYVVQAFVSFYPTFLREYHHLNQGQASLVFGAGFLVVAVGLPVVGRLADRGRVERVLLVPFSALVLAVLGLLGLKASWIVVPGTVLLGIGLAGGGAIAKRAMAHFDADTRGTGFGIIRMLFVLFGSLANVTTGTLAEYWGWGAAYGIPGLLGLASVGLLVVMVVADPRLLAVD